MDNKQKGFGASLSGLLKDWKVYLLAFVITIVAELIGTVKFDLSQNGSSLLSFSLFPMLFAIMIGLILCAAGKINTETMHKATPAVTIGVAPLIVFLAKSVGPAWPKIVAAGPALILQEFGNLGTIVVALPFALLLGFKRESIGMTHSIAREPNVGLIASKYGLDSPEGRGVMTTYIVGTLLGTIFIGLFAGFLGSTGILHPYALGMACGVGSGSMMAASSAALTTQFPEMADQITAYAGTSNVLSNADGIVMTVFIGLPMCNWLYDKLEPVLGKGKHI